MTTWPPDAIILDTSDARTVLLCHVFKMQIALPSAIVICLCPTEQTVRLVSCEPIPVHDCEELIVSIEEASQLPRLRGAPESPSDHRTATISAMPMPATRRDVSQITL